MNFDFRWMNTCARSGAASCDGFRFTRGWLTAAGCCSLVKLAVLIVSVMLMLPTTALAQTTLEKVRNEGILKCGVTDAGVGLSEIDASGRWSGFFVDFCRAFGTAVLGRSDDVEIVQLNSQVRFDALRSGAVDLLSTNATWTVTRDSSLGISFPTTFYYDGQGFMAHRSIGGDSISQIGSGTVCVMANTTTEKNLADMLSTTGQNLSPVSFKATAEMFAAFFNRRCDIMTTDRVALASQRASRAPDPSDFIIYPDVISKEPLGPAVRSDDMQWFTIAKWIVFSTIAAEELGITSSNADAMRSQGSPEVRRLLGGEPGIGVSLGLDDEWAYRVIREIGNYGEIFDRHIGPASAVQLDRGLNAQWSEGGLMYAPPIR